MRNLNTKEQIIVFSKNKIEKNVNIYKEAPLQLTLYNVRFISVYKLIKCLFGNIYANIYLRVNYLNR